MATLREIPHTTAPPFARQIDRERHLDRDDTARLVELCRTDRVYPRMFGDQVQGPANRMPDFDAGHGQGYPCEYGCRPIVPGADTAGAVINVLARRSP